MANRIGVASGQEEKSEQWRSHLAAWRRSGQSQVEFCRQRGLSRYQFTYWKTKLTAGDRSESVALVEVPQTMMAPAAYRGLPAASPSTVVIKIGRYGMEIPVGFCRRTVSAILDELEGRL